MQIKLIFTGKVSHFNSLVLRASVFGTWKWSIVFWLLGKVINGSKKNYPDLQGETEFKASIVESGASRPVHLDILVFSDNDEKP